LDLATLTELVAMPSPLSGLGVEAFGALHIKRAGKHYNAVLRGRCTPKLCAFD